MTRLLVFGDDLIELIDNGLLQVVQCKEHPVVFNSIWNTVCMQVLEHVKVALLLVDLPQPLNHQLPVMEVESLYILYIHCSNSVTPVLLIK